MTVKWAKLNFAVLKTGDNFTSHNDHIKKVDDPDEVTNSMFEAHIGYLVPLQGCEMWIVILKSIEWQES